MASSSSSSSSIQKKYDVFISFRGTDTRDNFTSHLYVDLCRKKIHTFIDNELERGDVVSDALLRTISESKISVIIFSENYASSKWCLDELVKIMECKKENGQTVVPVFFNVDPSHVRHRSSPFKQALARHGGHPKIQTWRDVLTEAANLSGWDSQVIRPEAKLVESIVTDIIDKLKLYRTSTSNFGNLIGMSSHFEQIESLLGMINKDVHIIGLWGMGGIGKTTIATKFFEHFFSKFEGHCMILDIRETCEKRGLSELQEKLVLKDGNLNIGTPNLGSPFIRDRLLRMKVLIVLDDVSDFEHLKLLDGFRDSLGSGSIVMITSRDKQLLINNEVDSIYEVPELNYNDRLCLFNQHAFKQEHLLEDHHMRLSERAVDYAKGNPLALRILGSHLNKKSKRQQESALRKLERTPDKYVQKVLRISYDGLEHEQKDLFLNIACFFKGESVSDVVSFHDAPNCYPDNGLDVLEDKSLVTVRKGQVWMHDLLQEMGRQIVREESIKEVGKRSRLWDQDDICDVLTKNTGTEAIEGILLEMIKRVHDLRINPTAFERMHNLEFLKIACYSAVVCLPLGLDSLPNKLRYLYWQKYPLTYLPSNIHPENLVTLKMPFSRVERLWNGRQNLVHLKEIDLSSSEKLIEIPDLSLATSLERLNLRGCSLVNKFPEISSLKLRSLFFGGTAIEEVPSIICNLKSLVYLDLDNFRTCNYELKLKPLEGLDIPLKKRDHQQEVNIHSRELTDGLAWLSALEYLNLSGNNFQEISAGIKQLTHLRVLGLVGCRRLQSLPQLPMNILDLMAEDCMSLEMVASPSSIIAGSGVFSFIWFDFRNCWKLNQNARNNIVANVESRLLHWETNYPENIEDPYYDSYYRGEGIISFPGGDVPDWFKYKSRGSSLTEKLPPDWCNADLLCLVFCFVVEIKYPEWLRVDYNFHIRTNGGDRFHGRGGGMLCHSSRDDIRSNQVDLVYHKKLVNDWRKIPKGADDADEISIEFYGDNGSRKLSSMPIKCGVHLLYTRDIEDRCRRSVVQPNTPCGDLILTQLSLKQDCVDDVEESMIHDAEDSEGYNENSCNAGNLGEDSASIPRRKMKWKKLNTFNFTKFLRIRRKSTQKVSRNNFKVKYSGKIQLRRGRKGEK